MNIKKSLSLLLVVAAPTVFAFDTGRSEFKLADLPFSGFKATGSMGDRPVYVPFAWGAWNDGNSVRIGGGIAYKQFGTDGAGDFSLLFGLMNNTPGSEGNLAIAGLQLDKDDASFVKTVRLTYVEGDSQDHLFAPSLTVERKNVVNLGGLKINADLTGSYNYFVANGGAPSQFAADAGLSTMLGPIGIEGNYTFPSAGGTYDYYVQGMISLMKNTGIKVKYDRAHDITVLFAIRF